MSTNIAALEAAVLARRPFLAKLLEQYGERSVGAYVTRFTRHDPAWDAYADCREQLIVIAHGHTERLLGREVADALAGRLACRQNVLTADHHGPLMHPILVSGDLFFGLGDILAGDTEVIPIFAVGGVPVNNITLRKGGLLFTQTEPGQERGIAVGLFGHRPRSTPVHTLPAYGTVQVNDLRTGLARFDDVLSVPGRAAGEQVIARCFEHEAAFAAQRYADQVTIINNRLWPMLFRGIEHLPQLVYLEIEDLVREALIHHLLGRKNLVSWMLFDKAMRAHTIELFNGIPGCWTTSEDGSHAGTFMFWGVHEGERVPLWFNDQYLVDPDGKPFVLCNPNSIRDALRDGSLMPSLLTSFVVVAFHYGFRPYGGFMQCDYLTRMKQAAANLLARARKYDELRRLVHCETDGYATGPALAFIDHGQGPVPAGSLDIIAHGGLTRQHLDAVAALALSKLQALGLPGMYPIVVPKPERDSALSAITTADIIRELGLEHLVI